MLILKIALKFAINIVNKSPIIFKIFFNKILKLSLNYKVLEFRAIFMQILLPNYCFRKKQNGKKDLVRSIDLNSFKIVFTLSFAKVIVI